MNIRDLDIEDIEDLIEVNGIGPKMVNNIIEHFSNQNKENNFNIKLENNKLVTNKVYYEECKKGMLKYIPDKSIPAIITDPPYNLSFMNRKWDFIGTPKKFQEWNKKWAEIAYRKLKPGGFLLVFGSTRTYHRMVAGIEDAGFEIKDTLNWLYGTGFPKGINISKSFDKRIFKNWLEKHPHKKKKLDKLSGKAKNKYKLKLKNEANLIGEVIGKVQNTYDGCERDFENHGSPAEQSKIGEWGLKNSPHNQLKLAPVTELAKEWEGWRTALKPAHELILLAQKPRIDTYCENIKKYGIGALNIDECRIFTNENLNYSKSIKKNIIPFNTNESTQHSKGRFPSNLLLTHHPKCELRGKKEVKGTAKSNGCAKKGVKGKITPLKRGEFIDRTNEKGLEVINNWECVSGCPIKRINEQSGILKSGDSDGFIGKYSGNVYGDYTQKEIKPENIYADQGGAARYFNQFHWRIEDSFKYTSKASTKERTCNGQVDNKHPTVKPIELIKWLIKLVVPKGEVVVDLFGGSGTLALACIEAGYDYIIFENKKEHYKLINERIKTFVEI